MKVWILWYIPKHNYDKEPEQIWGIYKTEELAKKEKEHIKQVNKQEHGFVMYEFRIEDMIVKEEVD